MFEWGEYIPNLDRNIYANTTPILSPGIQPPHDPGEKFCLAVREKAKWKLSLAAAPRAQDSLSGVSRLREYGSCKRPLEVWGTTNRLLELVQQTNKID